MNVKTLGLITLVGAVLLAPSRAAAQSKTLQGEMTTATVTITGIEASTRTLDVVDDKGIHHMFQAPSAMARFNELKVGDKINARYYDNVVIRLKKPGEAPVDVDTAALTASKGGPGATLSSQRTITATITAIDPKVPSITVEGPNGWKYSSRVEDKKALASVKVGDKLDITWTAAIVASVEPVGK